MTLSRSRYIDTDFRGIQSFELPPLAGQILNRKASFTFIDINTLDLQMQILLEKDVEYF